MRPVNMADPGARRAWLDALRGKLLDLVAAAEDATRPKGARFFSRAEQRRRIAELERGLVGLLDEASGTLRPLALVPPTATPGPATGDDEGPPSTVRPS
ncbi:MAG: hypothetical protein U0359_19210 [Byssovorax sp.]